MNFNPNVKLSSFKFNGYMDLLAEWERTNHTRRIYDAVLREEVTFPVANDPPLNDAFEAMNELLRMVSSADPPIEEIQEDSRVVDYMVLAITKQNDKYPEFQATGVKALSFLIKLDIPIVTNHCNSIMGESLRLFSSSAAHSIVRYLCRKLLVYVAEGCFGDDIKAILLQSLVALQRHAPTDEIRGEANELIAKYFQDDLLVEEPSSSS